MKPDHPAEDAALEALWAEHGWGLSAGTVTMIIAVILVVSTLLNVLG